MIFKPGGSAPDDSRVNGRDEPVYILYSGRDLCVRNENNPLLSQEDRQNLEGVPTGPPLFLGYIDESPCFALEWNPGEKVQDGPELPRGFALIPLRPGFHLYPEPLVQVCARGRHLLSWRDSSRFCGFCGDPLKLHPKEAALECPSCSRVQYPRISPAVITAVFKEDRILLANNRNFPSGIYSLIAGFVDPGESLEQTVAREIREEVNLNVRNIRYRTSQPWPFPDSLMCAFTAEYESGELVPDGHEILDARWFSREDLPDIPARGSVSRELIDMFLDKKIP